MAGRRRAKHCCRGFTLRALERGCKLDGLGDGFGDGLGVEDWRGWGSWIDIGIEYLGLMVEFTVHTKASGSGAVRSSEVPYGTTARSIGAGVFVAVLVAQGSDFGLSSARSGC